MIQNTNGQDTVVKQQRSYKKHIIALLIFIAVIALYILVFTGVEQGSISVERVGLQISTVTVKPLIRDVAASGKVVAANAPKVYSPERGFIDLKVQAGDNVSNDDVIAIIDSPELTNELKQQQSVLAKVEGELQRKHLENRRQKLSLTKALDLAGVELNAAKREHRRAQFSIKKNLISKIDYEKAIDDLARANLFFKHAQQEVSLSNDTLAFELKAAERDLSRQQLVVDDLIRQVNNLTITASVTGIVGNLLVQQKAAVSQSQPLMTLVDLANFEAELQVPEIYANELGLGMEVELTLGAKQLLGRLSAISPEVNNREVTTRVRFNNNTTGLRQNQRLTARILLDNRDNVRQIKRGAFMREGGNYAYKVIGDTAHLIDIKTGASSINAVELLSGVQQGEQLIISNYDRFKKAPKLLLR